MIIEAGINGLALGCIYALLALGFVLIFKETKVVNFAQGEMMMACAYFNYLLLSTMNLSFFIAIVLTFLFGGVMGFLLERLIIRPMVGEPLFAVIIVTIGLATMLRALVGTIWGHNIMVLPSPIPDQPVIIMGIGCSVGKLVIIGVTILLVIMMALYFKLSKQGIAMRAVSMDSDAALIMGIKVRKIYSQVWIAGGILSALSALLVAPLVHLTTHLGVMGLNAFPAAILGGFGSLPGAVLGGLVLGVAESIAGGYLPEGIKALFPWMVLMAVLIVRPEGFLGNIATKNYNCKFNRFL